MPPRSSPRTRTVPPSACVSPAIRWSSVLLPDPLAPMSALKVPSVPSRLPPASADLHYNHGRSHQLADDLIDEMNRAGGDVLAVVGDTAVADGDALERCLSRFRFAGPKLFVAGNHELWTHGPDSYELFHQTLPSRVRSLGWHWLQDSPMTIGDVAVVGSVGWYDYSFAQKNLGIPLRFYEAKIS